MTKLSLNISKKIFMCSNWIESSYKYDNLNNTHINTIVLLKGISRIIDNETKEQNLT